MSVNISIPTPTHLLNQTCTVTTPVWSKAASGVPTSTATNTIAGTFGCFLQDVSATELVQYGGDTGRVVYNLFVDPMSTDGLTAAAIPKDAVVVIDGVTYTVIAQGVDRTSAGCLIVCTVELKS